VAPTTTEANEAPVSPRLAALERAVAGGDGAALARFWRDVTALGTPLLEAASAAADHFWVTFLWRATDSDTHVEVVSSLGSASYPAGDALVRLPGTDVWYRTYRARADLRASYLLRLRGAGGTTHRPDPLNRRPWVHDREGADPAHEAMLTADWALSTVALPGAPAEAWWAPRPGTPAGRVEAHRVPSAALAEARRVWVYTSPGHAADGPPARLVLLFDGWHYVSPFATPTILDNLAAAGRLPPLVAVMVDNPPRTRARDLRADPAFEAFITRELLPWVHARVRAATDPAAVVVGGASAGGLAASALALAHPDRFGNVLAQSGGFWWSPGDDPEAEWLARQVAVRPRVPVRFYLNVGLLETSPTPGGRPSRLVAVRHFRTVLHAKGYAVQYAEFMGGHENICWRATLAEGLLALLGDGTR
jgi:enterochelin esterase-like enzyme